MATTLEQLVQNHSSRSSDYTDVYPVISRRARGLSLGVNLSRTTRLCSFRCVYCQVLAEFSGDDNDSENHNTIAAVKSPSLDLVRLEVELRRLIGEALAGRCFAETVAAEDRVLRDIALSGDGEPTLAPEFPAVCDLLARLWRELLPPATKLVLITNAAHIDRAEVLAGIDTLLAHNGEIWGKLDAATDASFQRINAPRGGMTFERIVHHLTAFAAERPLVVQTCLFNHAGQQINAADLDAYIAILQRLVRLQRVLLYTTARGVPSPDVVSMTAEALQSVGERVAREVGVPVEMFV